MQEIFHQKFQDSKTSAKDVKVKGRGKIHLTTCYYETSREKRYSSTLSLISSLDGGGWLRPCPSFRYDLVPIVSDDEAWNYLVSQRVSIRSDGKNNVPL